MSHRLQTKVCFIVNKLLTNFPNFPFILYFSSKSPHQRNDSKTKEKPQTKETNNRFRFFVTRNTFDVITLDDPIKTISSKVDTQHVNSNVSYLNEKNVCPSGGYFNGNCVSELSDYVPGVKTVAL